MNKLGTVGKYNLCKGISTVATVGTPIITLACCSDFFVQSTSASISATGVFAILFAVLFLKDKIAENLKVQSAFVVSTSLFVILVLVENILQPMKYVCLATAIASGIDKVTFENLYKRYEILLPEKAKAYKYSGFLFTTTKTLEELTGNSNLTTDEEQKQQ